MNKSGVVAFLAIGLVITIVFELLATGPLNRWEYGELMPTVPVIGVGASPVAQWVILPLIQLWFVKRLIVGGGVVGAQQLLARDAISTPSAPMKRGS